MLRMDIHKNVIVNKPWGYEYLVFESEDVALWLLHIKFGESTSMHCHPKKTTGLILASGTAELSFIADSKTIIAPEKEMIRRGLFHSTKALSPEGIYIFEIETPNDKEDLVRLFDTYGRSHSGYESQESYLPKEPESIWIREPSSNQPEVYKNNEVKFSVHKPKGLDEIMDYDDNDIIMFLRGGLGKVVNERRHLSTVPGDIGRFSILKIVASQMEFLEENTLILKVG